MLNPPHPASIIREDILPSLGLNVSQAAAELGVTRVTLSRLLNEKSGISPEMALRIEKWLGVENGGSAESWIQMQCEYDLSKARESFGNLGSKVKRASIQNHGTM
jgi:addiction module HigA family antidote